MKDHNGNELQIGDWFACKNRFLFGQILDIETRREPNLIFLIFYKYRGINYAVQSQNVIKLSNEEAMIRLLEN